MDAAEYAALVESSDDLRALLRQLDEQLWKRPLDRGEVSELADRLMNRLAEHGLPELCG